MIVRIRWALLPYGVEVKFIVSSESWKEKCCQKDLLLIIVSFFGAIPPGGKARKMWFLELLKISRESKMFVVKAGWGERGLRNFFLLLPGKGT